MRAIASWVSLMRVQSCATLNSQDMQRMWVDATHVTCGCVVLARSCAVFADSRQGVSAKSQRLSAETATLQSVLALGFGV